MDPDWDVESDSQLDDDSSDQETTVNDSDDEEVLACVSSSSEEDDPRWRPRLVLIQTMIDDTQTGVADWSNGLRQTALFATTWVPQTWEKNILGDPAR